MAFKWRVLRLASWLLFTESSVLVTNSPPILVTSITKHSLHSHGMSRGCSSLLQFCSRASQSGIQVEGAVPKQDCYSFVRRERTRGWPTQAMALKKTSATPVEVTFTHTPLTKARHVARADTEVAHPTGRDHGHLTVGRAVCRICSQRREQWSHWLQSQVT